LRQFPFASRSFDAWITALRNSYSWGTFLHLLIGIRAQLLAFAMALL
jgi:hypothetical protein